MDAKAVLMSCKVGCFCTVWTTCVFVLGMSVTLHLERPPVVYKALI